MTMVALRLGLTGGIGSGKSTVARLLVNRGAVLIDADAISRAATAPGGKAIAPIAEAFGPDAIEASGALDRDAMRNRIFNDPTAKARLEGIIHPLVGLEISTQTQRADAIGAACIVFDIPLLVESRHWRKSLQRILVVDCLESTQVTRVASRNGLAPEEVEKIILAQATRSQRLAAADTVLFNDGISLDTLARLTAEIAPQFGL
jgi:dephospho-CoA kinase